MHMMQRIQKILHTQNIDLQKYNTIEKHSHNCTKPLSEKKNSLVISSYYCSYIRAHMHSISRYKSCTIASHSNRNKQNKKNYVEIINTGQHTNHPRAVFSLRFLYKYRLLYKFLDVSMTLHI